MPWSDLPRDGGVEAERIVRRGAGILGLPTTANAMTRLPNHWGQSRMARD